jgi:NADH-quinone oxidoreductase subunit J
MTLPVVLFYILAAVTSICAIAVVVSQNIVRAATWLLFALAGTAGIFFLLGANFVGATQLLIYVGGTLVLVVFGVMLTAQGPFINMRIGPAEWAIAMAAGLLLYGVLAISLVDVQPPANPLNVDWKPTAEWLHARLKEGPAEADVLSKEAKEKGFSADSLELAKDYLQIVTNETTSDGEKHQVWRLPESKSLASSKHLGAALLGEQRVEATATLTGTPQPTRYRRSKIGFLLPFEIVSVHLLVVLIGAAYLARAKRRRPVREGVTS